MTNSGCPGFLSTYNADANSHAVAYFVLYDSDLLSITLTVCEQNTDNCAPMLFRQYPVASLG